MKIAVVGATGLVGQKMLRVLEEQKLEVTELIPVASAKSAGKTVLFNGKNWLVITAEEAIAMKPQIALFSAGGSTSLALAPRFAAVGTIVIDNSSAWRKDPAVPLVVPEVNAHVIKKRIGSLPTPIVRPYKWLWHLPHLYHAYGIKRLVISTYQSVSGSGVIGVSQLENEQNGQFNGQKAYPHQIHMNLIPHGGDFDESGYTSEEQKLVFETRKIMEAPDIAITATVVRVPVSGGHSMAVNIELANEYAIEDVRKLLQNSNGLSLMDEPLKNVYPMPLFAADKDDVFVGRIRRDESIPNGLNIWVVADNLRKGAATNAVQIAAWLIKNKFLD
jgi:aspartate-semialdehyde dehydrogenase